MLLLIEGGLLRKSMGKEKRQYNRYIVENMDIHARTIFTTEIEILDISLGGARIQSAKRLKMGSKYILKLVKEQSTLPLKCIVVWEQLSGSLKGSIGESIPVYTAGIEFEEIFSEKLIDLMHFLDDFAAREKRLSGLRFKIATPEMVVINYQETFSVKRISLGGLLLESLEELHIGKQFPMELYFPDEVRPIKFEGRVASCLPLIDKRGKRFDIGVEFLKMSDDDRLRVKDFIRLLNEIENNPQFD